MCDLHFELVVWAGLCPASYCGSNPCGMIWGLLEDRRAVRMGALSTFSELELSLLNSISEVPKKCERKRISSNDFLLYENSAFLSSPLSCM